MKKLPEIYKEVVSVNNNKNIYYSKNELLPANVEVEKKVISSSTMTDVLKNIFQLGKNSYTKRVRIKTENKMYETRLIRRNNGKLLTIDNDVINENEIISLEIL